MKLRKNPWKIFSRWRLLKMKYLRMRKTIYSWVLFMILGSSLLLFLSFSIIFRSVNEEYLNTVIRQQGNNIGSIVRGALYHSMLENDKSTLQNTLDVINTMPGIDDVNLYDMQDNLVYTSIPPDTLAFHGDPNCIACHENFREMFPGNKIHYRIIGMESDCRMKKKNLENSRRLIIKIPIPNERSCYDNTCHAHKPTDMVLGSLIVKMPLTELDQAVCKSSAEFYLLALITTILLIFMLILFTHQRIKKPLNELLKVSIAVAGGDLSPRVKIKPNQVQDMKTVSLAFNDMLDNLESAKKELENWSQQLAYKVQKKSEELSSAQNELIHIERLASLGKLSSSVAHEINNPLSGILIYTKLILRQLSSPELTEIKRESILKNLRMIENEAKRCGDIVKGLLEFSRKDQENLEPMHLHEILQETCDLMSHPMKIADIHFYKDLSAANDLIYCSSNQIKQACIAMLVNSTEAVTAGGEVIIRTSNPASDTVRFEISDTGIGISPDDVPHIFEPFFSTKKNAVGIGLGLAIVHGIIQSHNGKIQVRSEPGKGTTMSVTLPLHVPQSNT